MSLFLFFFFVCVYLFDFRYVVGQYTSNSTLFSNSLSGYYGYCGHIEYQLTSSGNPDNPNNPIFRRISILQSANPDNPWVSDLASFVNTYTYLHSYDNPDGVPPSRYRRSVEAGECGGQPQHRVLSLVPKHSRFDNPNSLNNF